MEEKDKLPQIVLQRNDKSIPSHLMSFVKIIQNSEKIKCIKQYNEKKFFAENLNPYMCNQGIPEVSLGKASYLRSHKRKDELYLYTK